MPRRVDESDDTNNLTYGTEKTAGASRLHLKITLCSSKSSCPGKTIRLAFKFYPIKIVHLYCSKIHLIKAISNTKKELHWKGM